MTDLELRSAINFAVNFARTFDRASYGGREGQLFDGKRDIYDVAGYEKTLEPKHFEDMYERGGIATRAVDAIPDESWRKLPQIYEGKDEESGKDDTDFCKAWNEIATKGLGGKGLYHYLHRLDRAAGLGRFAVLYLGLAGAGQPNEPVGKAASLSYVTVFKEGEVAFKEIEGNKEDPRFGMPNLYNLSVTVNQASDQAFYDAHWSRCIHVVEDAISSDLFGRPRLKSPYNYMINLLKVLAGSGEAAWKLMDSGNLFTTTEGYELPTEGSQQRKNLEAQFEDFWNGLRRGMLTEGITSVPLGGQVTDPTGLVMINLQLVAATLDIPMRILMGSERGELASSQDSVKWLESIEERRQNHVTPSILMPTANRLIQYGVLPPPKGGLFGFKWPKLVKDDRVQSAQTASTIASALSAAGIEIEPDEFVRVYTPEINPAKIAKKEVPEPLAGPLKPMATNALKEILWGEL